MFRLDFKFLYYLVWNLTVYFYTESSKTSKTRGLYHMWCKHCRHFKISFAKSFFFSWPGFFLRIAVLILQQSPCYIPCWKCYRNGHESVYLLIILSPYWVTHPSLRSLWSVSVTASMLVLWVYFLVCVLQWQSQVRNYYFFV